MKKYEYKNDEDYEKSQRKTSKSKRKYNHYQDDICVEKFEGFKKHFEEKFKDKTTVKILCVGARNNGEAQGLRRTFPNMNLDITSIDIIGTKSRLVKSVRTFLNLETIEYGNMHALQFSDESFDFIHSNHSFEHTNYPDIAAKELSRVTKKGGLIYICVPHDPAPPNRTHDCIAFENVNEVADLFGLPTLLKEERNPTEHNVHFEFWTLMEKK